MRNKRLEGLLIEYRNMKKYYCDKCVKKDNCNKVVKKCIKEGLNTNKNNKSRWLNGKWTKLKSANLETSSRIR